MESTAVKRESSERDVKNELKNKIKRFIYYNVYVLKNFGDTPLVMINREKTKWKKEFLDELSEEWSSVLLSSTPIEFLDLNFNYDASISEDALYDINNMLVSRHYKDILQFFKKLSILIYAKIKFNNEFKLKKFRFNEKLFELTEQELVYLFAVGKEELYSLRVYESLLSTFTAILRSNLKPLKYAFLWFKRDINEAAQYFALNVAYFFQQIYPLLDEELDLTALSGEFKLRSNEYVYSNKLSQLQERKIRQTLSNVYEQIYDALSICHNHYLLLTKDPDTKKVYVPLSSKYDEQAIQMLKEEMGIAIRDFYCGAENCVFHQFYRMMFFISPIRKAVLEYAGAEPEKAEMRSNFEIMRNSSNQSLSFNVIRRKYELSDKKDLFEIIRILLPEIIDLYEGQLPFYFFNHFYTLNCCSIDNRFLEYEHLPQLPQIVTVHFTSTDVGEMIEYPLLVYHQLTEFYLYCISSPSALYILGRWFFKALDESWMKIENGRMKSIVKRDVDEELKSEKSDSLTFTFIEKNIYSTFKWRF